jgi:hypothetical protein
MTKKTEEAQSRDLGGDGGSNEIAGFFAVHVSNQRERLLCGPATRS